MAGGRRVRCYTLLLRNADSATSTECQMPGSLLRPAGGQSSFSSSALVSIGLMEHCNASRISGE